METELKAEATARFNNLDEILADPKCAEFVCDHVEEINQHRVNILNKAPKGAKLKRGAYEFLDEAGLLNPSGLLSQFKLIEQKKSVFPASAREFIVSVIYVAARRTAAYYDAIDKKAPVAKFEPQKKTKATKKSKVSK